MFKDLMQKFTRWIDPKLDKYRTKKPTSKPTTPPKYTPHSLEEFIDVLKRTPKSILSDQDRDRIAAIMCFEERTVGELMVMKPDMVFVDAKEILGPLTLDKLYKSGFVSFPVLDSRGKVKGIIHTEALNTLEIKKTDRAEKYLDKTVHYLHASDSLEFAVEEINRLSTTYFLVLDSTDTFVGFFTVQMLLDYLLK